MRNKIVTINGKDINVQEKRIGELEGLVRDIFPESKGKIANIDITKVLENIDFDLLYKVLPKLFPELEKDDVKNAFMSEIEDLFEAFIDVNFTGIKRLIKPLMGLIQAGIQPGSPRK